MVRNLKAAEAAGRLTNKLGTYLRSSVLVVDKVGYRNGRARSNLRLQDRRIADLEAGIVRPLG
ncbi:hypothetical protein SUDANB5_00034 [Streptomyces sp. SudanB5_2050]